MSQGHPDSKLEHLESQAQLALDMLHDRRAYADQAAYTECLAMLGLYLGRACGFNPEMLHNAFIADYVSAFDYSKLMSIHEFYQRFYQSIRSPRWLIDYLVAEGFDRLHIEAYNDWYCDQYLGIAWRAEVREYAAAYFAAQGG